MNTLSRGFIVALSAILAWLLGLPHVVQILFVVQVLDIVSGMMIALGDRSLSSALANIGIRKKLFAWIIVMLVAVLQFELSDIVPMRVVLDYSPVEVAALGFIIVEALSIIENGEKLGVPLPGWLKRGLASAQGNVIQDDE